MTKIEKVILGVLIGGALIALIISMATGLLGYTNSSIGSSISALLISVCIITYCLMVWKK
ncbi:MAG: hypothetical protein E7564_05885 [Ruminococcaceae bacterium]|nr:hypothetical protein [Oscillospiraceae bacterium]